VKPESKAPPSKAALLLIDVINHFEFPDGEQILRQAMPIAPRIARLKARAREAGIPAIYVNDNFGHWRPEASKLVEYCKREGAPSRKFVEQLRPDPQDYFVLKPMHSAFYQTPLELLLRNLGAATLILCGLATNSCVVCTAHDARMRNFRLFVPADCTAARTRREYEQALAHIASMTDAGISPSPSLKLKALAKV
jgi:nicotinamidase-related amidase